MGGGTYDACGRVVLVVFSGAGGFGALFAEDAELLCWGVSVYSFLFLWILLRGEVKRTLIEDSAPLIWAALVGI